MNKTACGSVGILPFWVIGGAFTAKYLGLFQVMRTSYALTLGMVIDAVVLGLIIAGIIIAFWKHPIISGIVTVTCLAFFGVHYANFVWQMGGSHSFLEAGTFSTPVSEIQRQDKEEQLKPFAKEWDAQWYHHRGHPSTTLEFRDWCAANSECAKLLPTEDIVARLERQQTEVAPKMTFEDWLRTRPIEDQNQYWNTRVQKASSYWASLAGEDQYMIEKRDQYFEHSKEIRKAIAVRH